MLKNAILLSKRCKYTFNSQLAKSTIYYVSISLQIDVASYKYLKAMRLDAKAIKLSTSSFAIKSRFDLRTNKESETSDTNI